MFQPLSEKDIKDILMLQIHQIKDLLAEKEIQIDFTEPALNYLASKGFDIAYGARPIKRLLQKELINELATKIIAGEITKEHAITVDCKNGKLEFLNR